MSSHTADEISTPDFWILCSLLAEGWDEESVDVAELKEAASALAACLYSFEESDIHWELRTTDPSLSLNNKRILCRVSSRERASLTVTY